MSVMQVKDMPYRVAEKPWAEYLGSQAAHIRITTEGGAGQRGAGKAASSGHVADSNTGVAKTVYVEIPWRRRDKNPQRKRIIITDMQGNKVPWVRRLEVSREKGRLLFRSLLGHSEYMVYYLPYKPQKEHGYYKKGYYGHIPSPKAGFAALTTGLAKSARAEVISFYARTPFDTLYPMKTPLKASEAETFRQYIQQHHQEDWFVVGEYREYPIWMEKEIPLRWGLRATSGAGSLPGEGSQNALTHIDFTALRNEYYAFQLGVVAWQGSVENLSLEFEFAGPIGAKAFTCYNLKGVDIHGKPFTKEVSVPKGKTQALWIGIDIPQDTEVGSWSGTVVVRNRKGESRKVTFSLTVKPEVLADRGDSDPTRFSRIRWMNSTIALENKLIQGFDALALQSADTTITYGEKSMTLAPNGLPLSISANHPIRNDQPKKELLAAPVELAEIALGNMPVEGHTSLAGDKALNFTTVTESDILWQVGGSQGVSSTQLIAHTEFDGYTRYTATLKATQDAQLAKGVTLRIPIALDNTTCFMGLGHKATKLTKGFTHRWRGPYNSFWVGNTQVGLHCTLLGSSYEGPMQRLYKPGPPPAWHNRGKGRIEVSVESNVATISVATGGFTLKAGESITFEWAFLLTPVQKINPEQQFTERYNHFPSLDAMGEEAGVKVVNIHHATETNPYINYPFLKNRELKSLVQGFTDKGIKTKVYYTLRELTSRLPELPFLLSLGDEVLARKMARRAGLWLSKPHPWLREHVDGGCGPEWYAVFEERDEIDIALLTNGESRWYNYYLEGLNWMMQNLGISGIYMDDVSFDRSIVKRIRRILNQKEGSRVDLHSNTGFSKGPATQYTTFFPFMDKLWFGESFKYQKMSPEQYLVESSGIPFGLMGDMLQDGGNRWRGMLYGMTNRYPWPDGPGSLGQHSPVHIWKVWDTFDIAHAELIGYWESYVPVTTSHPKVFATVYRHKGRALVALASWAKKEVEVRLNIDWDALGIDSQVARLKLPQVEHFQAGDSVIAGVTPSGNHKVTGNLNRQFLIPSGRGLLVLIEG